MWPKIGQYLIKYKEKWEREVKKRNDERGRDDEMENEIVTSEM
jgi:hypothetical protein